MFWQPCKFCCLYFINYVINHVMLCNVMLCYVMSCHVMHLIGLFI